MSGAIRFQASGLLTLLTDFGQEDPYVGILKGVLLARCPAARIVDLTHGVPAQDVARAAFFLEQAWPYFPEGSIHVAVVDPGVGSARPILAALHAGQAFLAPDNGLLSAIAARALEVRELDVERFSLPGRSRTFHGRDVFAPAAAALASGLSFDELGPRVERWQSLDQRRAERRSEDVVEGQVLFADRFGNLVTNVSPEDLAGPGEWVAEIGGQLAPVRGTYADAGPGEWLALVDSFDRFEVAIRGGNALERLGSASGSAVVFRRRRR